MRTRRRSARSHGVLLLTPLLTLAGTVPATAGAPTVRPPTPLPPRPRTRRVLPRRPTDSVTLAADPAAGRSAAAAPTGLEPAGGLETAKTTRPVAPGSRPDLLRPVRRRRLAARRRAHRRPGRRPTVDYLYPGAVGRPEPLRGAAGRGPRGRRGQRRLLRHQPLRRRPGRRHPRRHADPVTRSAATATRVAVTADGLGRVIEVYFDGTATLPTGRSPLTQFNNRPGGRHRRVHRAVGAYSRPRPSTAPRA